MSGKIDDPLGASLEAWRTEPAGWAERLRALALKCGSVVWPAAAIVKIVADQFAPYKRFERIDYLFDAVHANLNVLESQIGAEQDKVKQLQERLESPRFQEAVAAACEEAARASSLRSIERLAAVLMGAVAPSQYSDPNVDLAALIRDTAQVGVQDIRALELLKVVFRDVVQHLPNLNDPNAFTERMQDYRTAIAQAQIDPENFYASCARLNGFGLAIEVLRSSSRMHLHEYLFRPTRRGLALLDCLERFAPSEKQAATG